MNVYNDNKWIRIDIKSLKTNKTNFFKLKHKKSYYYLSENNDLKFESLIYLIELVIYHFLYFIIVQSKILFLYIINRPKQVLRLKMRSNWFI